CATMTIEAMQTGEPRRARVASGARVGRWLDYSIYPSRDGLSIFFQDITDRERTERSLAEATSLLQATLDSLSSRIAIIDEKAEIIAVNEAWRKFGPGQGESGPGLGQSYFSAFFAQSADAPELLSIREGIEELLQGKRAAFRAIYPVTAGSVERSYRMIATRFTFAGTMRVVIAHEDVTDVQVAQAAIDQLSERLLTLQ